MSNCSLTFDIAIDIDIDIDIDIAQILQLHNHKHARYRLITGAENGQPWLVLDGALCLVSTLIITNRSNG